MSEPKIFDIGDLIHLIYEAVMARKTVRIHMTLGSDEYACCLTPEGAPPPAVVSTGTYTPDSLSLLTRKQVAGLNELLARLGLATAEVLVRDKKWVVHLLEDGTTVFESPLKGGGGFEQPKGEDGWLTRAYGH